MGYPWFGAAIRMIGKDSTCKEGGHLRAFRPRPSKINITVHEET